MPQDSATYTIKAWETNNKNHGNAEVTVTVFQEHENNLLLKTVDSHGNETEIVLECDFGVARLLVHPHETSRPAGRKSTDDPAISIHLGKTQNIVKVIEQTSPEDTGTIAILYEAMSPDNDADSAKIIRPERAQDILEHGIAGA